MIPKWCFPHTEIQRDLNEWKMQTSKFLKIVQNLVIFGKIARTPTEEIVEFWTPKKYSC